MCTQKIWVHIADVSTFGLKAAQQPYTRPLARTLSGETAATIWAVRPDPENLVSWQQPITFDGPLFRIDRSAKPCQIRGFLYHAVGSKLAEVALADLEFEKLEYFPTPPGREPPEQKERREKANKACLEKRRAVLENLLRYFTFGTTVCLFFWITSICLILFFLYTEGHKALRANAEEDLKKSKAHGGVKKFKTVVHLLEDSPTSDDMSAEQKTYVICFVLVFIFLTCCYA
jgi:hypothetical protein